MTDSVRLHMSMSLDGFITGPDDKRGQGLGRNGGRLFDDLGELRLVRRLADRDVTHLRYEVLRTG